jgi:predicted ATP-grasp superfamily ATP-dependent carboligase
MMPARGIDALVLDGDRRGALAVVRSLGRAHYAVAVEGKTGASRFARAKIQLPDPRGDQDRYGAELVAAVEAIRPAVVMTASDWGVETLDRRRSEISCIATPAVPEPDALRVATSKHATLQVAAELGIPVPRSFRVEDPKDVLSAATEVGYPCVLKPDASWRPTAGGRAFERVGAVLLRGAQDVAPVMRVVRPDAPATVQEYAPGRREALMIFCAGGRILARFAMTASRTWPPLGGSSVMRESISLPSDSTAHAELLVRTVNVEGYSEVEFRRSSSGTPLLMEVNPRFSESIELALMAGVPFAAMQLEWARGGRIPVTNGYSVGARLSWARGELYVLGASVLRKHGSVTPWPSAAVAVAGDYLALPRLDGVARDDPVPMVRSVVDTLVGDPVRLLRKRKRSKRWLITKS